MSGSARFRKAPSAGMPSAGMPSSIVRADEAPFPDERVKRECQRKQQRGRRIGVIRERQVKRRWEACVSCIVFCCCVLMLLLWQYSSQASEQEQKLAWKQHKKALLQAMFSNGPFNATEQIVQQQQPPTSLQTSMRSTQHLRSRADQDPRMQILDNVIMGNLLAEGTTWVLNPDLLPSRELQTNSNYRQQNPLLKSSSTGTMRGRHTNKISWHGIYFRVSRRAPFSVGNMLKKGGNEFVTMAWELEYKSMLAKSGGSVASDLAGPKTDYTKLDDYVYPKHATTSITPVTDGSYPILRPLREVLNEWPQDEIDFPPSPIQEELFHFDFTDPNELELARRYRDEAKLPFKLINVPDLKAADVKWTDEYLSRQFDSPGVRTPDDVPTTSGKCQESRNNFFAFFQANLWDVETMGLPPTRNNDWTFSQWSKHARYADAIGLHPERPHFYWQSGVPAEERTAKPPQDWTFVSRDLPLLSSPGPTFLSPHPAEQKGIQCRFGERGSTAAIHYDGGQNMVAMIQGAKRYILAPPNQCSKLGIVANHDHALSRHSILNLGHLKEEILKQPNMPQLERKWLEEATGNAMAVETVLKAGEVLFIPSHWFHYITSLQKNGQCNVRSGVDEEGTKDFGGQAHILPESCDRLF